MRPFHLDHLARRSARRLAAAVRPIARTERVALEHARGRVAAADVASPIDVPPFARSAMDGYAVVAADTAGATPASPVRLRIVDRIYTGQMPRDRRRAGHVRGNRDRRAAARRRRRRGHGRGDRARRRRRPSRFCAPAHAGQNIGRRGADIAPGDLVVRAATC